MRPKQENWGFVLLSSKLNIPLRVGYSWLFLGASVPCVLENYWTLNVASRLRNGALILYHRQSEKVA